MVLRKNILSALLSLWVISVFSEEAVNKENATLKNGNTSLPNESSDNNNNKYIPIDIKPTYISNVPEKDVIKENVEPQNKINVPSRENSSKENVRENKEDTALKEKNAVLPKKWILRSALRNAPQLLKGIAGYLQIRASVYRNDFTWLHNSVTIPSSHRFILVGPPGSGKTTLAYAIGDMLKYEIVYIPATSFFGQYRNQTSIRISKALREIPRGNPKVVIIIDELHKLFEHHTNDHSDDSQSAAAFWLALDEMQKYCPDAIVIGTANNISTLPPEIKSRFAGKIINIPLPDKKQQLEIFIQMLGNDKSMKIDPSLTEDNLSDILQQMTSSSLRDLQLLIDTAKMFYYAEHTESCPNEIDDLDEPITTLAFASDIILTKKHFQKALDQLKIEATLSTESLFDSPIFRRRLQGWGTVFGIVANTITLIKFVKYLVTSDDGN